MTHYDTLDSVLNLVYGVLIRLIKECKKVIVSDATIDLNTFNLLACRKTNNKTVFIKNVVKKFKGIPAIRHNDENKFIDELRNHIKDKKYFLIGCDQKQKIKMFFQMMIDEFPEQKGSFIMFNSEQFEKVKNADEQFLNKYVFYSPSITTGVSFVLKDVKQTQFIYITHNPLITPISIYQMSCRTRNLSQLIYYCNPITPRKMKHQNIEEVEDKYKKMINYNNRLFGLSSSRTEDDDIKIVENCFFKLFCYNEFQNEIFTTGFLQHYENMLKRDGFELSNFGEQKKMEKGEALDLKIKYDLIELDKFDEFVDKCWSVETEEDIKLLCEKYKILLDRLNLLNIGDKENTIKYQKFIRDDYALKDYFNLLNLFKTKDYVKLKHNQKSDQTFKIKLLKTTFNKLSLLEKFETHYKIERLQFDFKDVDEKNEIGEDFKTLYEEIFPRKTTKNYKSKQNLLKIYVNIIKDICGDIKLIKRVQTHKIEGKKYYGYKITEILTDIIELAKFNNNGLKNFNLELIEKLTSIKPDVNAFKNTRDEDNTYNEYLYSKQNFKQGFSNTPTTEIIKIEDLKELHENNIFYKIKNYKK